MGVPMSDRFDVVVVGARCAGSPLAIQLARAGLRVAVVDRARFPSDTPSTHFFQTEGIASLDRLGVLDRVAATGAPYVLQADMRVEDIHKLVPWPTRSGDPGGALAVRRPVLDTILVEAAQEAGAQVRCGARVTNLVQEAGRVKGVRVGSDGQESELHADLVVGADGRGSTVGSLVGARFYNVTHGERFFYWAYFEGTRPEPKNTTWFHRWEDDLMIGFPCDDGTFLVGIGPPSDRLAEFSADVEKSFESYLGRCEPLEAIVGAPGVKRIGRFHRMTNVDGYLRESAGPGWALVGDAGHFKDPTPAQGISDALRQVDRLAPAIIDGLAGQQPLDAALHDWWRWRDDDAAEHHWFATDLGAAGRVPVSFVEALRKVTTNPEETRKFLDLFNHRTKPSEFLTPKVIGTATLRLLRRGQPTRSEVLREFWRLLSDNQRRVKLNKRPAYAGPSGLIDSYPEADLAPEPG